MLALLRGQHLDVVLAADVADHHAVGAPVEVLGAEALEDRNALVGQLGRHGRIDVFVRAAHVVAGGLQQARPGSPCRCRRCR